MRTGRRSEMAAGTALFRAAHLILDGSPKILDDPLAEKIIGPEQAAAIGDNPAWHARPFMIAARTLTVVRSRCVEDELARAVESGVSQYVVLGAGLDTSAYRPPVANSHVAVFEIDHPDTQQWKLERLRAAEIAVPENVRHAPCDFETQSLGDALAAAGFERDAPAFFSWLGVSYYLGRDAVFDTLGYVAGGAAGSRIVFDFGLADSELSQDELEQFARFSRFLAENEEPWLSRFAPESLRADLRDLGFRRATHIDREQATQRDLRGRSDGLHLDIMIQMMSAEV